MWTKAATCAARELRRLQPTGVRGVGAEAESDTRLVGPSDVQRLGQVRVIITSM